MTSLSQLSFTIGIPTHNRLEFLKQSISAALAQTYSNLEVIVSDNSSSDGTEAYCRGIKDSRFRYLRHDRNTGLAANFRACLEAASGEYFSWLQDDDLVFHDFVNEVVESLQSAGAEACLAGCVYTPNPACPWSSQLRCSPLNLDWCSGRAQPIHLNLLIPLSLFTTVGIPPVAAFRSSVLLDSMSDLGDPDVPLYEERLLLVAMARRGLMVILPKILGVFRSHEKQYSRIAMNEHTGAELQFRDYADEIERIAQAEDVNLMEFQDFLKDADQHALHFFAAQTNNWSNQGSFVNDIKGRVVKAAGIASARCSAPSPWYKTAVREACPPLLYRKLQAWWQRTS